MNLPYENATGTLAIQFKGRGGAGSTYEYANVPQEVYESLRDAEKCSVHHEGALTQ